MSSPPLHTIYIIPSIISGVNGTLVMLDNAKLPKYVKIANLTLDDGIQRSVRGCVQH